MITLKTASFLPILIVAVAAVGLSGDTPIINISTPAPTIMQPAVQPEQPIGKDQQKSFDQAYRAMQLRQQKSLERVLCPSCIPPCPPICP